MQWWTVEIKILFSPSLSMSPVQLITAEFPLCSLSHGGLKHPYFQFSHYNLNSAMVTLGEVFCFCCFFEEGMDKGEIFFKHGSG